MRKIPGVSINNHAALTLLNHLIAHNVLSAEKSLIGASNETKHSIVESLVIKELNRIYDPADERYNLGGLVDLAAKEVLIPLIGSLISSAVDCYKLFGWELWNHDD